MQQILIHIIPIYFACYAFVSLCYGTHWSKLIKFLIAVVLLIASQYAALSRAFYYGHDGQIPHLLLVAFAWIFSVWLFIVLFSLIKDLYLTVRFLLKQNAFIHRSQLSLCVLILATLLGSFANYSALKQPNLIEQNFEIAGLPKTFEGFKIVQISDLHASALLGRHRNEKIVATVNALHPDLIVITGDLVDGTLKSRKADLEPLAQLNAPYGVIAIEGNHEHYVAHEDWRHYFPTLKMRWLENDYVLIQKNHQSLAIAGITDPMAYRYQRKEPSIEQAIAGIPKGTVTILLAHQVKNSALYAQYPIALQLSGHTHGGQICGAHWLAQSLNNGWVKDRYRIGDMQLYINRGTGLWFGFPIRLGIESEITLITLKRAEN